MKILFKVSVLFALITNSYAGLVNAISVIIDDEPITLYEIYKYANKLHISTKESLNILIRQKLEDAEIKKLHIRVSDFEVDSYIKRVAAKNGISEFQFLQMLKEKGIKEAEYRRDLKMKIKQDKLYRKIYSLKKAKVTQKDVKKYYDNNRDKFVKIKDFKVIAYKSPSKESLAKIKANPMLSLPDVEVEKAEFHTRDMDPKLEELLSRTKTGDFTPPIKMIDSYTMFFVKERTGKELVPFSKVEGSIYSFLASKREKEVIDDYFEKIKSVANIQVIRKPRS